MNAKLIVYFTLHSTAKDVTALPVPVMAAQTGVIVVLTNINIKQAKDIADVIAPLLKQGLSPYQILASHPELGISEKTL